MDKETDELNTDTDIANDLSAAYDALTEQEEPTDGGHETVQGDVGGGAPDTGTDTAGGPTATDDTGVPGDTTDDQATTPAGDTAPVSLPPDAREVWKDTPPAMKAAIAKREADYAKGVEKYRNNAQRAEQMDTVLGQYQHYFAMTGEPPGRTIDTLLRTASNLHMAPGTTKAQIIAGLINQYQVPIDVLDGLLAGDPAPQGRVDDVDTRIQQALQPFQQIIQQQQQREQYERQQQQGKIANELTDFAAKNEFYNDVAADMADFLDVAARNGRNMTLADAYQRACSAHPTISQIVASRAKAPTQRQLAAASTLRGNGLGSDLSAHEPDSIKAAIEAAWDTAGRM
jgi:hypothetical protein